MDEIWLPSKFNLETFSRSGVDPDKLRLVPYPIQIEKYSKTSEPFVFNRETKKFKFLYNCAFSFRKGIDLLVQSYCMEFSDREDVSLILKMYVPPGAGQLDVQALIRSYIPHKPDNPHIDLLLQKIPSDTLYSLYQSCDCYVSTDRANGWGMPCMEMMAMGKPAITIDWSGSTQFMHETNSFLIKPEDELEDVDEKLQHTQAYLYKGHKWAKVTVDSVRKTLREAFENESKRNAVAKQAKLDMAAHYSVPAIAKIISAVLDADTETDNASKGSCTLLWQGPQAEIHSLSKVNRNICKQLRRRASINLYTGEFQPVHPKKLHADVAVCHQWPPSFTVPLSKHWVLMQPWEFGALPMKWYAPMKYWVDQVWVYSRYNKECYVRSGIDENKIKVIPLGVDEAVYHPHVETMELKAQASFRFLFVGGTIWRKGVDILLDAYTQEFNEDEDVCLVIKDFGTSSFYAGRTNGATIADASSRHHQPKIHYLDQEYSEHELASLYKACDCLVHPYRGEGFGLPIIEAMACGTPVIVPDKGPTRDFCDEESAFLIPSREITARQNAIGDIPIVADPWWLEVDRTELRRLMRYAYENRSETKEKGRSASLKIRSAFTWKHTADAVQAAIQELL
ncbi:glycosyltransferase [Paenibacillus thailandensis]|uniref:Glycosyltransferase n=1 Tax=Paenibacillus thailandensis TaxID=393250 RepID=A0ABW5QZ22_9BACL